MLDLTDEQRMILGSVDKLAREEFADAAGTWQGDAPWPNVRKLADKGFLGINFDEEYGGGGMTEFEAMLMIEIIGRVCPETGQFVNAQQMVGPRAVEMFGTEAAKEKYLPPVLNGEDAIAIAISEPGAGSDVRAMQTEIEDDGGELALNGEKIWVSDVAHSSATVLWTKFPDGIGSIVLEFDWPGVEIENQFTNMAGQEQAQFVMDDVHVPPENVLTRGEDAFKRQLQSLNWERLGNAAMTNGMACFAFDSALEYAQDRKQFDQSIADFQGIEWEFAEMATNLETSRAFAHQAAKRAVAEGRRPNRLDSSIATLYAAQVADDVVDTALQIHGANAYQQGHPIEYLYRNVRGWRIGAGTDEIQKSQIAAVLKESGLPTIV